MSALLRRLAACSALATVVGCQGQSSDQDNTASSAPSILFEDASAVLDFQHRALSSGGHGLAGAAWFDYDNDGLLDLFLPNGRTQPNALFRNLGDGTFENVAATAGVENGLGNAGAVAADIDNDGFQDLFLTGDDLVGDGRSPVKLYRNNQDATFADITDQAGIGSPQTSLSAALADIDNDGDLDLFIAAPGSLSTLTQHRNKLYRNNGDLTFSDISSSSGVNTMWGACAALFTDHNEDGSIDLFVANCNDVGFLPTPIELFRNNGDLTFTNIAADVGLTRGGYWMGLSASDFDNDGDLDIFATNLGAPVFPHALYELQADGTYRDVARMAGAADFEFGWGTAFTDLDNDSFADIFFAGSLVLDSISFIGPSWGNPGTLLVNNRDGTFADLSASLPLDLSSRFTSGVAFGDYDNDGCTDLVVGVEAFEEDPGRPVLYHNAGNDNRWLTVRLQGTTSNRDAVGARVEVVSGDVVQTREIYAGSSVLSTDTKWLTFGLGRHNSVGEIRVCWPSGLWERYPGGTTNRTVTLVEGMGSLRREDR